MKTIFLIALVISTLPNLVEAFTLNSSTNPNFKGWSSGEIKFNLNTANCPSSMDVKALMEDAFAVWNAVPTSPVQLKISGTTTSTAAANPVTVYCETNFQAVTGADANFVPGAAAIGTSGDYAGIGIVYLNVAPAGQANITLFNRNLLTIILAHEIGHIIGLGHSHDKNALMYYDASAKTTLNLSQDDFDGLSYLYPRDELGKDQPMGCGFVSQIKPPSGPYFAALLLLLILPVLVSLKLRQGKDVFKILSSGSSVNDDARKFF